MKIKKYILILGLLLLIKVSGFSESNFSRLDDRSEITVDVYPNPTTSSQITINAEKEINKIELLNILGEKILSEQMEPSTNVKFSLGDLKNGIYIVKITFTDNTSSTKRLWVK